ncbi:hypothetical protein BJ742DRAFT_190128 [Cladochytrium replicatum]|nr:hypothetical protein BJ742DRAFT_190128 [Cladochytrium replicatum]
MSDNSGERKAGRIVALNERSKITDPPSKHSCKLWLKSVSSLFDEALVKKDQKEYEAAYVYFLKSFDIMVRIVPKCKDFNREDFQYMALRKKVDLYWPIAEELKKLISEDGGPETTNREQENTTPRISEAKPPQSPSLSARGTGSAPLSPFNASVRHPSGPLPTSGMSSDGLNLVASGLRGRTASAGNVGNGQVPPTAYGPSPFNTPPSLAQHVVSPNRNGIGNGTPIARTTSPEFLIEQLKGSRKQNGPRCLLLDVRPIHQYIMGHIKWRKVRRNDGQVAGGVVHIDPEWITPESSSVLVPAILYEGCGSTLRSAGPVRHDCFL